MLLLLLWQQENRKENTIGYLMTMVRAGVLWTAGYGITMAVKWTGASVLLKMNRVNFALSKATYWQGGREGESISRSEGILANIRMIAPFRGIGDDLNLLLVLLAVVGAVFCFVFLFQKSKCPVGSPVILIIACIPIFRFLVMAVHVNYHYFFTYRALYLTVTAVMIYMIEVVDWKMVRRYLPF